MTAAVIYCRISDDPTGAEAGVDRQLADCRAYCARNRFTILAEIIDNDVSASRYSRKTRPGYLEAFELLDSGAAQVMVSYNLDRTWRQPKELEQIIDMAERVAVHTLNGNLHLETPEGRMMARMLCTVAAMESDNTSRRVLRALEANAADGKPHGPRPFGYLPGGTDIDPAEAEAIRQAADRVLSGHSLRAICREWDAAGIKPPRHDGPWHAQSVRATLLGARIAGLRTHRGVIVGSAAWPPILDRDTWEAVGAVLNDPGRDRGRGKRTEWSGMFTCAVCGYPLRRTPTGGPTSKNRTSVWSCRSRSGMLGSCGVTIHAAAIEAYVYDQMVDAAGRIHATAPVAPAGGDDLVVIEAKAAELAGLWGDGLISKAEWLRAKATLEKRRAAVQARLSAATRTRRLSQWAGRSGELVDLWPTMSVDARRAAIRSIVAAVTVGPSPHRPADMDRVHIDWVDAPV